MYESKRTFKLWDYNVSHRRALVRSPQTPEFSRNIDLIFLGIEFLAIPSRFVGLEVEKADRPPEIFYPDMLELNWFVLKSKAKRSFIAAAHCRVLENELDIFESSLQDSFVSGNQDNLGTVIVDI